MTIGMLLNAPYPSDVRIKKEADALLKAGHQIHLICLRRKNETYTEQVQGIYITRIDAGKNNITLAFWDICMSIFTVHPKFRQKLKSWIKTNNIEVLHVHDLPLVGTALALKKEFNLPVIADFHENYPDALKVWFEWKTNPLVKLKNRLFMNFKRWKEIEAKAVRESDYVIAVVNEMKDRLIQEYKPDPQKIKVITNSEEQSFLRQQSIPNIYEAWHTKFKIVYTGNIGPHRGVDTVIEAMNKLQHMEDIVLIIVGSGSGAVMENLKKQTEKFELTNHVVFLGRQPFSLFYSYMHYADVNVIPHKSNSHTDHTIPHKLFQGMMAGKPMLVSSSAPLKRIIDETHAGLVFDAGNAADLSEKIKVLYHDKALCKQLGENGIQATVNGRQNWETDQLILLDLYKNL
ncbi:MAG: glycosyltransferase family 4 protein [Cyclobacteriaceae bacterium]|nr:glycosyltransferase family 4 protein [Cyclobacteriaceae bacterium]